MHESYKKFIREPQEDLKVRNSGSFEEEKLQRIINEYVEAVKEQHTIHEAGALDIEQEFGPKIWKKIGNIFTFAVEYFNDRGIDEVKFNPFYLLKDPIPGQEGENKRIGGITINNREIDFLEIKELGFLKTFAHELYHSSAAVSLTVNETELNENELHRDVYIEEGAGYRMGDPDKRHALEEGLASRFEGLALEKIKGLFPPVVDDIYEAHISNVMKHIDPEVNDRLDITINTLEGNDLGFTASRYKASRELVSFLAQEVPDFDRLVEEARLKRHTLPLARAVEKRFGEGAYRTITTCSDDDAKQLQQTLMEQ